MRLTSRFLGLALLILAAFWFAAANADEMVLVDLVLVRLRISLPLLVFGSVIGGMGVAFLVGWRAEQRARRQAIDAPAMLHERAEFFDPGVHEFETTDRDQREWH